MIKLVPYTDEQIFRGSRPDDYDYLKKLGIKSVLCLEDNKWQLVHENMACHNIGIRFSGLPMDELKRPDKNTLSLGVYFMQILPKPLLVHCLHGKDRTGYMIAKYRMIVQGWPYEKAWKECLDEGHRWLFYFWWRGALK
jgi:tyrosine-protein phosphatase SIW14